MGMPQRVVTRSRVVVRLPRPLGLTEARIQVAPAEERIDVGSTWDALRIPGAARRDVLFAQRPSLLQSSTL